MLSEDPTELPPTAVQLADGPIGVQAAVMLNDAIESANIVTMPPTLGELRWIISNCKVLPPAMRQA
jgi:hypothetical protein